MATSRTVWPAARSAVIAADVLASQAGSAPLGAARRTNTRSRP